MKPNHGLASAKGGGGARTSSDQEAAVADQVRHRPHTSDCAVREVIAGEGRRARFSPCELALPRRSEEAAPSSGSNKARKLCCDTRMCRVYAENRACPPATSPGMTPLAVPMRHGCDLSLHLSCTGTNMLVSTLQHPSAGKRAMKYQKSAA